MSSTRTVSATKIREKAEIMVQEFGLTRFSAVYYRLIRAHEVRGIRVIYPPLPKK